MPEKGVNLDESAALVKGKLSLIEPFLCEFAGLRHPVDAQHARY